MGATASVFLRGEQKPYVLLILFGPLIPIIENVFFNEVLMVYRQMILRT